MEIPQAVPWATRQNPLAKGHKLQNQEKRTAWGKYLNCVAVAYADAAPVDDVLGRRLRR